MIIWENSFARNPPLKARQTFCRVFQGFDRSTILTQLHWLSGHVRRDELLTASQRVRGNYTQNDFAELIRRTFWAVPAALELPEISGLIDAQ